MMVKNLSQEGWMLAILSFLISFLIFLYLVASVPLIMHSFPTRRSSVLVERRASGAPPRSRRARGHRPPRARRAMRSEEHTSELQSRVELVCRLLLETKNGDHGAGARQRRRHRGIAQGRTRHLQYALRQR